MARADGPLTICVINMKGGVGKSTITALLSRYAFSRRRKDVLAIDLDPQANLSQGLMHASYRNFLRRRQSSIVEIFAGYRPPTPRRASGAALAAADVVTTISQIGDGSLELIPSRFDFADALIDAVRPNPRILARFLANYYQHKDLILIDCAPTESILTRAAYHASGLVLVPVKPEYFATIGFPLLQQSLTTFRRANRAHTIEVAGVVINNAFYHGGNDGGPEKARAIGEIRAEAANNNWTVFQNEIPFSRGFPKMMRGDYSYSGNADLFPHFANEFLNSIGL